MITFCMGSARQKRAYFSESNAVVLDNTEVLFGTSENGRNYFAIGKPPFSTFTVEEYIKYSAALTADKPDLSALKTLGISPRRRIGRLAPAELRAVDFVAHTRGGKTDKSVVINLDGTRYSRRNARTLKRLLALVRNNEVYVCVSDTRFLAFARTEKNVKVLEFGKRPKKAPRPSFYSARILAARLGAKKVCIF